MTAPYRHSGPLADLVSARDIEFNEGKKLERLRSVARQFCILSEDPDHLVQMYRADFFVASGMYHEAWRHDRETAALWRRKSGGRSCSAAEREEFFGQRMQNGIQGIEELTGFDLAVSVPMAFAYYVQGFVWLLCNLLRKKKRKHLHVSLDGDDAWLLPSFFDPDPTDLERLAILKLAHADLPEKQRVLADQVAEGIEIEHMTPALLRSLFVMRENLRILYLAHDMAQSLAGRELIVRAARQIEKGKDASLVTDHFTVAGTACTTDLFSGKPLDALATDAESEDASGDKVRFRNLRALRVISALLEESSYDAFLSLPRAQLSVLKVLLFHMVLDPFDARLPSMTPVEKELALRRSFRDFGRLQELYHRAKNGKSLHALIHHRRLKQAERDLLERILVKKERLEEIAKTSGVNVEFIKKSLLAAATEVIKLKN